MKKKLAFVLCAAIAISSLAGCGKNNENANNDEKITLKWTMAGPSGQKDQSIVFEELNKQIKTYEGLENVDLDITIVEGGDYKQKFMLWQTSKEKLDIVQTYGLDYATSARDGNFYELDSYIENSEDLKSALPDFVWNYAVVDGKKYYVPSYQILSNADYAFVTPKALADKYLDVEKAQRVMDEEETFTDACWDVVENYLDKLAAAGEIKMGYQPLDSLTHVHQKGYVNVGSRFVMKLNDPDHKVYYWDELPERINSFKRLSQLYKKGYVRSDIASAAGNDSNMIGTDDGYMLFHSGSRVYPEMRKVAEENLNKKYGKEFTTILTKNYDFIPEYNAAGGMAISVMSKNPDEAFKVIELVNSEKGKDFYNMLAFGIQDKHYKVVEDGVVEPISYVSQASSSSDYGLWKWNTGNTKYAYAIVGDTMYGDKIDEANTAEEVVVSPLTGFVMDTSNISAEIAQIDTVFEEYKDLNCGSRPDVDAAYNEYMKKIKTAGMEKVKAELQKQVDEFFKNKK